MHLSHYSAMVITYVIALVAWVGLSRWPLIRGPQLWPSREIASFNHPWLELGLALLAVTGVIGIGQIWSAGCLLPEIGSCRVFLQSINQIIIFAPIPLLLIIRRHSASTAWLPLNLVWARLGIGAAIAVAAIFIYDILRNGGTSRVDAFELVVRLNSLDKAVQVFLEDLSIAILLVRFASVLKSKILAVVVTGGLFATAHIPGMISGNAEAMEYFRLILDGGLAIFILSIVQRSSDIWWFFCLHYVMDMMQFLELPTH